jgi:hypothetical protein
MIVAVHLKEKGKIMATDWSVLEVEYINTSVTMRELAEKHGIKASGVFTQAVKRQWDDKRKQSQAKISKQANRTLELSRTELLEKLNLDDLDAANAIKAKARQMLEIIETPNDLRALSASLDVAQKISRLALGVETSKTSSDVSAKVSVENLDLKGLSDKELEDMRVMLAKTIVD